MLVVAKRQGITGIAQNIQLMVMRLSCFGRNLALNDEYESVQSAARTVESSNHGRLIPFSAMMSIGILIALVVGTFFG